MSAPSDLLRVSGVAKLGRSDTKMHNDGESDDSGIELLTI